MGGAYSKAICEFKTRPINGVSVTCSSQNTARTWRVHSLLIDFPHVCLLAVSPGAPLFGHGREHLADVRGQEVVHFVALKGGQRSVSWNHWRVGVCWLSSPERFHTAVCCLGPGFRWWCGNTCCRCSSWRSWWRDEWWGAPAETTAEVHHRTTNFQTDETIQTPDWLTFDLGSMRLTPCLLIAIRRVSG